jgi:hypothetical protein
MTWRSLILGVMAASMGSFLIINTVRPYLLFSPSKYPSPYLHPVGRTAE